jgi:hypothetical protein
MVIEMDEKVKLSSVEARADLTNREVAKLIGSVLGGLVQMAEVRTVQEALRWWLENPLAWAQLEEIKKAFHEVRSKSNLYSSIEEDETSS